MKKPLLNSFVGAVVLMTAVPQLSEARDLSRDMVAKAINETYIDPAEGWLKRGFEMFNGVDVSWPEKYYVVPVLSQVAWLFTRIMANWWEVDFRGTKDNQSYEFNCEAAVFDHGEVFDVEEAAVIMNDCTGTSQNDEVTISRIGIRFVHQEIGPQKVQKATFHSEESRNKWIQRMIAQPK